MYSAFLFFFMSVAFGASSGAGTAASNMLRFVPLESRAAQGDGVAELEQRMNGVHSHGKISTVSRRALVLVALAIVLAVIFLALQCFKALNSRKSTNSMRRRLAVGGDEGNGGNGDPCKVSDGVAGQRSPWSIRKKDLVLLGQGDYGVARWRVTRPEEVGGNI